MRFVFAALILSACGLVYGEDAVQSVSVLANQPTLASAPSPAVAPSVVTPAPEATAVAVTSRCRNGRCCVGSNCRLYNVEESVTETTRPRVFGGYVKRNTARTVYRPSRR